jgi:predicted nucleic acid-binding protein
VPKESELFLVDSSGWIEFLADGPLADRFAPYFEREDKLVVPVIVLYEVYKKLLSAGGSAADRFLSAALRSRVAAMDERLAFSAARISLDLRLAMADAMIYATALAAGAQIITSDSHFQGLPQATVF